MSIAEDKAFPVGAEEGLNKRELFAAMAMQGYRANPHWAKEDSGVIAAWSLQDADKLIAELSKAPQ
jgi:hypothetical protein